MDFVRERFYFILLGIALFMTIEQNEGKGYEEPVNCGHLECPSYQVIHTQQEYEIRRYQPAMWVAAPPIISGSYRDAAGKGFRLLYAFIQGKNDRAVKINMTAPVLTNIYPSTRHNSSFVVHFYLPQKYQNNPPQSNQAHPVKLPKHQYAAVKRYGGFMNDTNIAEQFSALRKSLKSSVWEPSMTKEHSVAGYNSPDERDSRVNEVILWLD